MAKRPPRAPSTRKNQEPGLVAAGGGQRLRSVTLGALPVLERILKRMKLEEILMAHLPRHDPRSKLPTAKGLMLLVKNLLVSREPIYGLGEWAARYDAKWLGLEPEDLRALNDDRVGRCLGVLFDCDRAGLILALVRQVVAEFALGMDEFHNDSTSVSFYGAYRDAGQEGMRRGRKTLAITYGYSKDHRPDLKQLLYILTITSDGGVPIHFRPASGNVTDDTTHRENWNLLCQIAGRRDFLYVADCKLATIDNMNYIAAGGGRFVTVLPRTRKEDATFRRRVQNGDAAWHPLWDKTDEEGKVIDRFSICDPAVVLPEGHRLWWFHSTRKAELDLAARAGRLQRAEGQLRQLQQQLRSPRARHREPGKVQDAVDQILRDCEVRDCLKVEIGQRLREKFRQQKPGRPGKGTLYNREVSTQPDLEYTIDAEQLRREGQCDGIFPLVTNDEHLDALAVLHAYKRQPQVEKRFEQFKTDFAVAPVFLKDVGRIEALFCVYFFVLLAESLLERELRRAMERERLPTLPMYPEGRPCRRPTARRLIDLFEPLQRHTLEDPSGRQIVLSPKLSPLHTQLLRLLRVPATLYDA
jgi:transposase